MKLLRAQQAKQNWFGGRKTGQKPVLATLFAVLALGSLSACQPLYLENETTGLSSSSNALAGISVGAVDTRYAQQVRNHLIFLLSGGQTPVSPLYEIDLTVTVNDRKFSTQQQAGESAGEVVITASYDLHDIGTNKMIASGSRFSGAAYDSMTGFAGSRARRDAENRAARKVAEQLRLAIAADLKRR